MYRRSMVHGKKEVWQLSKRGRGGREKGGRENEDLLVKTNQGHKKERKKQDVQLCPFTFLGLAPNLTLNKTM